MNKQEIKENLLILAVLVFLSLVWVNLPADETHSQYKEQGQ